MKRFWSLVLILSLLLLIPAHWEIYSPAVAAGEEAEDTGETVPMDEQAESGEISPDDLPEEEELEEEILEGRTLQYGDEGDDVLELQIRLKDLKYYTGNLSGRYREGTRDAVKTFQSDYGLEKTGIADPGTQNMIYSAKYRPLRYGASGEDVKSLQNRLTTLGYYHGKISGEFLEGTQKSIRQFQEKNGLTATGAADVATQQALFSSKALGKSESQENLTGFLVNDAENTPEGGAAASGSSIPYTKTLKSGSSSQLVKQLQTRMTELGYYDGPISGNFAKKTLRAVKTIQTQNGMKASGQVDENTWNLIFNDAGIVMPNATPRPIESV